MWFRQTINPLNDNSKDKALESTQYSKVLRTGGVDRMSECCCTE